MLVCHVSRPNIGYSVLDMRSCLNNPVCNLAIGIHDPFELGNIPMPRHLPQPLHAAVLVARITREAHASTTS